MGVLMTVCAVAVFVFNWREDVAKEARDGREKDAVAQLREDHEQEVEDLRTEYTVEFAALFAALSSALDHPGDRGLFESFIGKSADKFLSLVGNHGRHLRVAIYRMDGREDEDTPEDDYRLERIGAEAHGRADVPRFEFKYSDPAEREVILSLESRDIIKWPDLAKSKPDCHGPSKRYKAFYTMPVVSPGNVIKGMVTCDSTEVGILGDRHEQSLRMIAHLVSVGLTLMPKKARIVLVDEDAEG